MTDEQKGWLIEQINLLEEELRSIRNLEEEELKILSEIEPMIRNIPNQEVLLHHFIEARKDGRQSMKQIRSLQEAIIALRFEVRRAL